MRTYSGLAVHDPLFTIGPDVTAPNVPTGIAPSTTTTSSVTLRWDAAFDNVGVTGYRRYRGSTLVSSGSSTSYTFTGLTCGTTYTLGVEAYDARGNTSARGSITTSTNACAADTTSPTPPTNQQTSSTQTTILMTWGAATDNVGVAGYRTFLNGAVTGTTTSLSYTYTGLQCATTYTVALEAYDAAGNTSNRAMAQGPATTAACPGDTQAPTTPANFVSTGSTATSISLSWGASLDNVGVTGYGVYNGATGVGPGPGRPTPSPASCAGRATRSPSTPPTQPATAPRRRRSQPRPAPAPTRRPPRSRPGWW